MAKALLANDVVPTFQFTGRLADEYFDMEIFGDYRVKAGLTFSTQNGSVSYLKTALQTKPRQFMADVQQLDLSGYDCVISDFEPVTAWAGKLQNKPVLGIGHQYAFAHAIPRSTKDYLAESVLRYFAPATVGIGLHWHHFNQPILPPIIETPELPEFVIHNKIVVYLPFESIERVVEFLSTFRQYAFHIYSPKVIPSSYSHIQVKRLGREAFQRDVADSVGIISNAGFELASEALQQGKKILVKPLHGQMEQLANAAALKQLGYGEVMMDLDRLTTAHWLSSHQAIRVGYPNVAQILVDWLLKDMPEMSNEFIESVWRNVEVECIECGT